MSMGSDFFPSRMSLPTGFLVTVGSPTTPSRSSVIWNAVPMLRPNEDALATSCAPAPAQTAPMEQDTSKRAEVFLRIIATYSEGWGTASLMLMEMSIHWPSQMSTQAPDSRCTSSARVLGSSGDSERVRYALEKSVSPASMARGVPYLTCVVGTPCRVSSLSMMSSWTSEKLCIISTAPAAAIASRMPPPSIWHVCISM